MLFIVYVDIIKKGALCISGLQLVVQGAPLCSAIQNLMFAVLRYAVLLSPVSHLKEIGKHLGAGHELAVPGLTVIAGAL